MKILRKKIRKKIRNLFMQATMAKARLNSSAVDKGLNEVVVARKL